MMGIRIIRIGTILLAAAGIVIANGAASQAFPSKAVRLIVPSAPGGSIDANGRIIAGKLQALWGQSVVVENRAGASMIIGAEYVAKSQPDGYTLLVAHDGTMSINPVIHNTLPYDPQRDFAAIALISQAPIAVLVHPGAGLNTMQDVVNYARANPGKLNHATGGPASLLALELFNALAGTQITSIPYKGAAPALAAVMAGEAQLAFADTGSGAATVKSGKVKVIGVATLARSRMFPDWPTVHDTGVPGYESRTWIGLFAPAGTPPHIVEKIGNDTRRTLDDPDIRARFGALNLEIVGSTSEELAATMRSDTEKWGRLVRERNIKVGQ